MVIMKCKECGKGCKHPIYEHWIKYQLCADCNGNMKAYDVPKKVTSKHLRLSDPEEHTKYKKQVKILRKFGISMGHIQET